MSKYSALMVIAALIAGMSGCARTPESAAGFRLPDGDAQAGRQDFIEMRCIQCHTVRGEVLPTVPDADPPYVELGGDVTRVKTYGELVSAIINPSHKLASGYPEEMVSVDGVSNMYVYNDIMTVRQLTNLVVFLQPHYEVIPPNYQYRRYP